MKRKFRRHSKSYATIAEENGISKPTYYARVHSGWDPEDASTVPVGSRRPVKSVGIKVDINDADAMPIAPAPIEEPKPPVVKAERKEITTEDLLMSAELAADLLILFRFPDKPDSWTDKFKAMYLKFEGMTEEEQDIVFRVFDIVAS